MCQQLCSALESFNAKSYHLCTLGKFFFPWPTSSAMPIVWIHHFTIQPAWRSASAGSFAPPIQGPWSFRNSFSAASSSAPNSVRPFACSVPKSSRAKTGKRSARSFASCGVMNSPGRQARAIQKLRCFGQASARATSPDARSGIMNRAYGLQLPAMA